MYLAVILTLAVPFGAICAALQAAPPKRESGNDTLSDEQLAVYRAILNEYMKDSRSSLTLSRQTIPLVVLEGCLKGFKLEQTNNSVGKVHEFNTLHTFAKAPAPNVVLVDPQPQIEEPKPGSVWPDLSLTEIAFDKDHLRAVAGYGFLCGHLCGNGKDFVMEKTGNQWKVARTCSFWISDMRRRRRPLV